MAEPRETQGWYEDTGCELAPRCLECPLPVCKYDRDYAASVTRRMSRDARLVEVWRAGASIEELMILFNVSRRTVFRATAGQKRNLKGTSSS